MRLTFYGKVAIFLAVFLLFSAQNTGNNLLFLMSSCFIAAVFLFGGLGYKNLSGVDAILEPPEVVYADEPATLKCFVYEKENRNHYSLGFEEDFAGQISSGDALMFKTSFKAPSRGRYHLCDFCIYSLFPFGLTISSLKLPETEVFVGPARAKNLPAPVDKEIGGAIQKFHSGKDGEYWMQKHYQTGEDASLINWTISARSDSEWVLLKAQNYGFPEKLYFNFSGIEGELFEDCLEMVMGIIFRLRNAGSSAFVWAEQLNGDYNWLSISDNYSLLVRWLAKVKNAAEIPVPSGECKGIEFADLLQDS
ncbi:MAG: hypothetical protein PWR01_2075 [Clostridiales bacterium]|nr:hypothetical protein [Clostridiales bacterium]MDN5281002.1 hypothetical protein [Candidatus Ozemobacter sp.]